MYDGSVIELALWVLIGKIRNEPVYMMSGGNTKCERLDFYCTGYVATSRTNSSLPVNISN
jgi:L-alanine-DL-glutamate epimerase-like enolase superfamily enzyme